MEPPITVKGGPPPEPSVFILWEYRIPRYREGVDSFCLRFRATSRSAVWGWCETFSTTMENRAVQAVPLFPILSLLIQPKGIDKRGQSGRLIPKTGIVKKIAGKRRAPIFQDLNQSSFRNQAFKTEFHR